MNDFVSKATFGFLMAQLFPGAIAVFAIEFAYFSLEPSHPATVMLAASRVLSLWSTASVAQQLFLVALCIGAGMLIHGLNWAVLGAFENGAVAVFDSKFHALRIIWQVLLGPLRVVFEVGYLVVERRHGN